MRTLGRSLAAAVLLAAGCLPEHGPLAPTNSTVRLALRVELQQSTAGERIVEIRARYRRANGDAATLPVQPTQVTIADGVTLRQPVVIDVGPCNADASRVVGGDGPQGCRFTIELTLKNAAGETLSRAAEDVGPVGPAPAEVPTFILSTPTITVAPANLTFSARAQQALPPAQTVTVGTNNIGATLGAIVTLIGTSGQGWLRAVIDQGAHTVTMQPTTTTLAPGTYTAIVGVSSSVDGMKAQTVPVTYQVTQAAALAVTGGGTGGGLVTSSPAGITCQLTGGESGGSCSVQFPPNAPVTLTARPDEGSTFAGWGAPCSGQGSCTVTLGQNSVTVNATFDRLVPILQLSPTTLTFSGLAGAGSPPRQSVSVVNGGTGSLSGVSITSIRQDGAEPSWLDATLSGTTISVGASPANLQAGNYSGSIVVGSSNGGTATLRVTFAVGAQPAVLRLSPTSLLFSATSGGSSPARQPVSVVNAGQGTLAGVSITTVRQDGSEPSWLTATLSGTTVSVGASLANLQPGTYTGSVVVGSTNGGSATLAVTFAVAANPPKLTLSPTSISFSGVSARPDTLRLTLKVVNTGSGTLTGVAVSSITYPGFPPAQWVVETSANATTVTVGVTAARLPAGTYTATILVVSSNGGNASLGVTFTVAPPAPVLGLRPNALTFGAIFGSTLPSAQTVRAVDLNGGASTNLGTLSRGANTSPWLTVTFDGDIVVVRPNSTTVGANTNTGIVTINSSRGGSATITVTYNLSVIG